MNIATPEKTAVLRKFLADNKNLPSMTCARILFKDNPLLWPTLESARTSVRRARGNSGDTSRSHSKKGLFRPPQPAGFVWKCPASKATPWESFTPGTVRNLILSDIHIPFHDQAALNAAIKFGNKYNPDCVILNGDTADFFSISRFSKNPTVVTLKQEINDVRNFLGWLQQQFPKARIIYKFGNHDERWDKFLWSKAPELVGLSNVMLEEVLLASKDQPKLSGIEFVKDQRRIMLGALPVLHGHELPKGIANPVNPARGAFLRTCNHVLIGHLHQFSEHTEKTLMGKVIVTYSTGCLCELTPPYARINRWSSGFATVDVLNNREFDVHNYRIINGKVY